MKERNYGRWMEEKMAEVRGIVRDYVRMRNIKRASVLEFWKLIAPAAGQSKYLQEEGREEVARSGDGGGAGPTEP